MSARKFLAGITVESGLIQSVNFDYLVADDLPAGGASQPLDATLTAFAALTIAANSLTIGSGADAFSQVTFAANTFPARASSGNLEAKGITDFGLSLVDDADAATARATLGLGTLATQSSVDHGATTGLSDDDHTQYALLAGRSGGQALIGGTAASNSLNLQSTSNGTRGLIDAIDRLRISAALTIANPVTPSAITVDQDDYNPANLSSTSYLRLVATTNVTITGLQAASQDGNIVLLTNISATAVITLADENASSSVGNRFSCPLATGVQLRPDQMALLQYDITSARWRVLGAAEPNTNSISNAALRDSGACSVIGRSANSSGDPADISAAANSLVLCRTADALSFSSLSAILDFIGSAAQGDILYRGAATWARLGAGTAGQRLMTGGTGANPSWAFVKGEILGLSYVATDQSTSSSSLADLTTADSVTITLESQQDVLVLWTANIYQSTAGANNRDIVDLDGSDEAASQIDHTAAAVNSGMAAVLTYKIASLSAGSHTIKIQHAAVGGGTAHWRNRSMIVMRA